MDYWRIPSAKPELLPLDGYGVCPAILKTNAGQRIGYVNLSQYKVGPLATSADCSQWDGVLYKDKNLRGKPGTVYMGKLPKGGGACPAGNAIRSLGECKAAAADRGLQFNAGATDYIRAGKFGKGGSRRDYIDCFEFAAGPTGIAMWSDSTAAERSNPSSRFSKSFSALCQGPAGENTQALKSYELSRGSVCPAGDQIRSKAQCEAAASKFGLKFGGVHPGSKNHLDCFRTHDLDAQGKATNQVWWSQKAASPAERAAPGGYWRTWHSPLCQNAYGK